MINIGLIGYGYWGPNLARNFNNNPDFELTGLTSGVTYRYMLSAFNGN